MDRFDALCELTPAPQIDELLPRQCRAAAELLDMDAVGVSLLLEGRMRMPLAASSEAATTAERAEFTVGEGPCLDAYSAARPVLVPDVADLAAHPWAAYADELSSRTPFRAVFALPLTATGLTIGTVSFYRCRTGELGAAELAGAQAVADRIFDLLIKSGSFAGQEPMCRWLDLPLARTRTVVWQAIGMATVELALTPSDTLALLRSYSYGNGRLLDDVAEDIVQRVLPLDQLHP